jgi:homoserine dehydrogenase
MNIALLGNGHVAQALIKIIDKTHNILLSYDRSSNFYDIPKNNDIDIVIDMLGHNDDAVEISRKIIKDSLSANKIIITCNKKLMGKYGIELCNHAKDTNGNLFINSLVASSKQFVLYPEYLSIDKFMSIQDKTEIFKYRGAGPEETAEFINNEIIKIGQLKNAE